MVRDKGSTRISTGTGIRISGNSTRPSYPGTMAAAGTRATVREVSARWPRARRDVRRFALLLLLIFLFIIYATQYLELVRARRQVAAINQEIRVWEQKCREMEREITYLKSPEYVEKIARERLGFVYPGETPFVVARPSDPDAPGRVKERKDRGRIIIGD